MSKREPRTPAYCHHKASGQAYVNFSGRAIYLGKFGSIESKAAYDRAIAEWLAAGRRLDPQADLTVAELCRDYLAYATGYYKKGGKPTTEVAGIKASIRPLVRLYGGTVAKDFKPLALKAVREVFVTDGNCRKVVNARTRRIVRIFKWASENEMVPGSTWHALMSVSGLALGRTPAPDHEKIKPVPEAFVAAVLSHVLPPVAAMIQVQALTGMRPAEVCQIRGCDIDMSGRIWIYRPSVHKTQHHGKSREIFIGPAAQEVIKPWLRLELDAPLFSPREAMEAYRAGQRANRKAPASSYHKQSKRKASPKVQTGSSYTATSYRRAIADACDKAGVPTWAPNRLRHNAATKLRKEYGTEVARIILGHSNLNTTEIYAEADRETAMGVVAKIG